MAKAKEEAGEGAEGEKKKKGGAKGLIIKIVPLVLIAFVVAKMTVLKPPPPTAAQAKAKADATKYETDTKCALANGMKPPKAPPETGTAAKKTTPTTVAKAELAGPVLDLDSKTVNLDGSHFLKIGVSLQLPAKSVPETVKTTENWGSLASQLVLDTFSGRSFSELSDDTIRNKLEHDIADEVCRRTEGKVVTTYFIDFVMQ